MKKNLKVNNGLFSLEEDNSKYFIIYEENHFIEGAKKERTEITKDNFKFLEKIMTI